mgnify:CR=1 FL=1
MLKNSGGNFIISFFGQYFNKDRKYNKSELTRLQKHNDTNSSKLSLVSLRSTCGHNMSWNCEDIGELKMKNHIMNDEVLK